MNIHEIIETCRSVARDVAAPAVETTDSEARWPAEPLRALQKNGLGGLVVPARFGGLGHGLVGLASATEELARACSSTSLCFGMHCVGSAVLAAKATEQQAERYLQPINEGRHLTTLALSEPGTGVHFYFPQSSCRVQPDGSLLVSGEKSFVTNGGHADSYVVSIARPDLAPSSGGRFSCVIVDRDAPGTSWGAAWQGLGLRGNASRDLTLADVPLPADRMLGEYGDQIWYVFQVVAPYFLTAMSGTYLGIAQAAFDLCQESVTRRQHDHSGRGVAHSPIVQHRLGTMWARIARTRALLQDAAARGDRGDDDALPAVLSVKAEVADCVNDVVGDAMTLTGGRSYRSHGALPRLLRDARAAHVMSPTTDLLRQWVGRALLGLPLLAE